MKHQQRLLKKIISENSATQYGKEHGFSAINSYRSYTQAVPIQEYESLGNYIAQQEQTKQPCLTKDQPVFYALTSGTTGRPKHIPVLQQTIKQHHRALAIFACVQNKATMALAAGC